MDPQEGSTPRMGRHHERAAGPRARESPTAAGTCTQVTPRRQEHRRAGDRTSRGRACGGYRKRSGSPRPEACMVGCSGRVSWGTKMRRWLQHRWPRSETTGQGARGRKRASEEGPADGALLPSAGSSATRQPRTRRGGSQPKDLPP